MKQQDIHQLIERFLDAETTLEEETLLYEFFSQDVIPSELEPYREMFIDLGSLKGNEEKSAINIFDEEKETVGMPNVIDIKPKIRNRWKYFGVAASIAALFVCGIFTYNKMNSNYAVAYINDAKIADDALALQIGTDAVSEIFNNSDDTTDRLYDIFNPE